MSTSIAHTVTADPGASTLFRRYIRADLHGLMRRPGVRIVVGIWLAQIVLFAYGSQYIVFRSLGDTLPDPQAILGTLAIGVAGTNGAASVPVYGIPVFIMLGALIAASDFRWGTIGLIISRAPERGLFLGARYLCALIITFLTAIATVVVACACSVVVSIIEGIDIAPNLTDLGLGVLVIAFTGGTYVSCGFALGVLARGTMPALLIGVGWLIGVETLLLRNLAGIVPGFDVVEKALLTSNTGSIAAAASSRAGLPMDALVGVSAVNGPWAATGLCLLWAIALLSFAFIRFRQRDLT